MKKLVLILFLIPLFSSATENLIITEVQIKGNDSYVKIYNPNNYDLDISGFKLRKKSSTGKEYSLRVFPKESFIEAKNYFVWANSRGDYCSQADTCSTGSLAKNNSVALFSFSNSLIDALAWGQGENPFVLGNSFPFNYQNLERKKDEEYQNTKDNSQDFLLEESFSLNSFQEEKFLIESNSTFPFSQGFSFSLFLAGISLFLKKTLKQENGWS